MIIPSVKITPQGYDAPSRQSVTDALWGMLKEAFGSNLNVDPRSPQGQLVTSLTAALTDRDSQFIELANNFDPRYSSGAFQEALGAVYFLRRNQGVRSVAQVTFTGEAGKTVPIATQLLDDDGNEWETTQSGAVSISGTVTLWAQALEVGAINASAGTINQMLDAPDGIDRVENITPAVAGSMQEGRVDYEIRRIESVSANSQLTVDAVRGGVFNVEGVIDVYAHHNPSDNPITVGETAYPMIRNSLLVSVVGGADYDIAGEIMVKGGTGCAFVGNTNVLWKGEDLYDDGFPPQYNVTFLRPSIVPVYFKVSSADYDSLTTPQISAIRDSILSQMQSGKNRARIGGTVVPGDFNCGLSSDARVVGIKVSTDNATWKSLISFGVDQMPVTALNLIDVVQYDPLD